jgi:hypothetical protein
MRFRNVSLKLDKFVLPENYIRTYQVQSAKMDWPDLTTRGTTLHCNEDRASARAHGSLFGTHANGILCESLAQTLRSIAPPSLRPVARDQ